MVALSPVFILCPGRSFSSVVCSMIGCHPQLFALPEVNLFCADTVGELVAKTRRKRALRTFLDGLLRTLAELQWGEQTEATVDAAWVWLDERADWSTTQVYCHIRDLAAPRRCVDKSPSYTRTAHLERLHNAFPDAPVLQLSRHPRAAQHSRYKALGKLAARGKLDASVVEADSLEETWYEAHRSIIAFISTLPPGQAISLRGEDLLRDPDRYLPQIAEWLGLDTGAEAIDAMKHPERSPFACAGPQNARAGNNSGFMEDPVLRIMKPSTERLEGPLEWARDPDQRFRPDTIALARQLGYQ